MGVGVRLPIFPIIIGDGEEEEGGTPTERAEGRAVEEDEDEDDDDDDGAEMVTPLTDPADLIVIDAGICDPLGALIDTPPVVCCTVGFVLGRVGELASSSRRRRGWKREREGEVVESGGGWLVFLFCCSFPFCLSLFLHAHSQLFVVLRMKDVSTRGLWTWKRASR